MYAFHSISLKNERERKNRVGVSHDRIELWFCLGRDQVLRQSPIPLICDLVELFTNVVRFLSCVFVLSAIGRRFSLSSQFFSYFFLSFSAFLLSCMFPASCLFPLLFSSSLTAYPTRPDWWRPRKCAAHVRTLRAQPRAWQTAPKSALRWEIFRSTLQRECARDRCCPACAPGQCTRGKSRKGNSKKVVRKSLSSLPSSHSIFLLWLQASTARKCGSHSLPFLLVSS